VTTITTPKPTTVSTTTSTTTATATTTTNPAVVTEPTTDPDNDGIIASTTSSGSSTSTSTGANHPGITTTAAATTSTVYIPHQWNLRTFVVTTTAGTTTTANNNDENLEAIITETLYLEMILYFQQRFGNQVETLDLYVTTITDTMWEYSGSVSFVPDPSTGTAILHEVQVWQAQIDFLEIWIRTQSGTVPRIVLETGQVIGEKPPSSTPEAVESSREEKVEDAGESQQRESVSAATKMSMTTTTKTMTIFVCILLTGEITL